MRPDTMGDRTSSHTSQVCVVKSKLGKLEGGVVGVGGGRGRNCHRRYVNLLGLLEQSSANCAVYTTDIYCLTVPENWSWKLRLLLRARREGSAQASLLSLLVAIFSLCVFTSLSLCACVHMSCFYQNTSHIGSGPSPMMSL